MMELEALQEIDREVRTLGAQIVALTPELERYTHHVHKRLNLTFDLLTDFHLNTAEQFRLVYLLADSLRDLYKSFGNTLDRFHDEPGYRLPMPARYVIGKEEIIRAADVNADYTIRPEPSESRFCGHSQPDPPYGQAVHFKEKGLAPTRRYTFRPRVNGATGSRSSVTVVVRGE